MSFVQSDVGVPADEGKSGMPHSCNFFHFFPEQLGFVIYNAQEVVFFPSNCVHVKLDLRVRYKV